MRGSSPRARVHDELLATQLAVVVVGVLAAAVILHGASCVPMIDVHLAIATHPTAPWVGLNKNGYLLDAPGLILLAHARGVDSRRAFALLAFAVLSVGLAWLVWLARKHHGDVAARLVPVSFFIAPIGAVLITWLGRSDPITMLAVGSLVLARGALVFLKPSTKPASNHFEALSRSCSRAPC